MKVLLTTNVLYTFKYYYLFVNHPGSTKSIVRVIFFSLISGLLISSSTFLAYSVILNLCPKPMYALCRGIKYLKLWLIINLLNLNKIVSHKTYYHILKKKKKLLLIFSLGYLIKKGYKVKFKKKINKHDGVSVIFCLKINKLISFLCACF